MLVKYEPTCCFLTYLQLVLQHVKIGDICENAKVVRVEKGSGLLLEIPSSPESSSAFVSVCDHYLLLT